MRAAGALAATAVAATALAAVLAACGTAGPPGGAGTRALTGEVRWLSLGDSYASGESLAGAEGACGRSDLAFAPVAVAQVPGAVEVVRFAHVACSGAVVADVAGQVAEAGGGRWSVVTLSIGGNDLGFADELADCLGVDDLWSWGGCGLAPDELDARLDAASAALGSLYAWLVADVLEPDGVLVVVDYPLLVEAPADWVDGTGRSCHGLDADDAELLRDAGRRLNDVIAAQARGVPRVVVVSNEDAYDGRGLCGEEPWLRGISVSLRPSTFGVRGSFHPTESGHGATAAVVLAALGLHP